LRVVRPRLAELRALARDPRLPRRWRWALVGLVAYLASPIDLIPDFIPVLGQLDDVVIAALVLRGARRALRDYAAP
jgi:uncharacterized membrane protein YkvA (DUF1232 family)